MRTRTDGKRLLVYTDSGNTGMKEAYAYTLDDGGRLQPSAMKTVWRPVEARSAVEIR